MGRQTLIETRPPLKKSGYYEGFRIDLDDQLIETVLKMYFIEKKTQSEISIETDLSQSLINRIIYAFAPKKAEEEKKQRWRGWTKRDKQRIMRKMEKYLKLHKEGKITLAQAARKAGVSYPTINKYKKLLLRG